MRKKQNKKQVTTQRQINSQDKIDICMIWLLLDIKRNSYVEISIAVLDSIMSEFDRSNTRALIFRASLNRS